MAHQTRQCGLAGSGWPQGPVTRSQPTNLGPGGTWAAPATSFMFPSFQLFWLFQIDAGAQWKCSESVSTVEKTFGHLNFAPASILPIPRTSFVLPGIGFGTSRVRKVTLQPTAAAVAVATRRRGAPLWRGGVLRRAGGSWPIGRRSSRPQRTKDHDLGAAQVRLPSLKGSGRERREIDTGVFRHQPRHRKPVKSSPSVWGSQDGSPRPV